MSYIRYQAGKKFDSELMSVFLKMGTKLKDIQEKYLYQSKSKTN
jgi:response regulator RpfG family c-di-GMP phosphodiesterase